MMNLLRVFLQGGPLMFPILLIVLVLAGIILRIMWHLFVRGGNDHGAIQTGLDGLLFWGGFAVVIGGLGSAIGYHKAMAAVAAFGVVSPRAVWIGTAEGLVSSIAGLLVLIGAGTLWFALRWRFLKSKYCRTR